MEEITKYMLKIDSEFKNLIPPLLPDERAGLEKSLLEEGCRDSIVVWNETIIDGHNRYEICNKHFIDFGIVDMKFDNRDDVIEWIYQNQLSRRNLTDEKRTYLIGKQYEHRKNRHGGDRKSEEAKSRAQNEPMIPNAKTYDIIAEENNIGRETVKRAEQYAKAVDKVAENLGNETKEKILSGELKTNKKDIIELSKLEPEEQAIVIKKVIEENKVLKNVIKDTERAERDSQLKAVIPIDTLDKFNVILIDPPWQYDFSGTKNRDIENHYPTMTAEELRVLPLPAMDDSVMFMWATAPKLVEAIDLLKAWGFAYKTCAVWDKEKIGMGYWFRGQHEILLVGVKGEFAPPAPENRLSSVIRERRTEHSKKPDIIYEMIEKMLPRAYYLEVFARNTRDGWGSWGNQV